MIIEIRKLITFSPIVIPYTNMSTRKIDVKIKLNNKAKFVVLVGGIIGLIIEKNKGVKNGSMMGNINNMIIFIKIIMPVVINADNNMFRVSSLIFNFTMLIQSILNLY
jgi:hypothetical protein